MALGRRESGVDARKAGSVDAALRRSLRAAIASDWPTAETWLERIVEADSADLDTYFALARLYREQGAIGRAIRMHQNLLLRSGLDRKQRAEALFELAGDFEAGGFAERAVASYEELLDTEPRHPEALRRVVVLLHDLREYSRGLALVKSLRRFDREAADLAEEALLLSQAQTQHEVGEHDAARATLKRCLKRYKRCGPAWALLGDLEVERGKDSRALDAWKRGIQADAGVSAALYPKLDAAFAAAGKPAEFEKFVRGVLKTRPEDPDAHVALARARVARGETREAIDELSRAIELAPEAASLRIELGRLLLTAGQESEALKAYSSLLDTLEQHSGLLTNIAKSSSTGNDTSDAHEEQSD